MSLDDQIKCDVSLIAENFDLKQRIRDLEDEVVKLKADMRAQHGNHVKEMQKAVKQMDFDLIAAKKEAARVALEKAYKPKKERSSVSGEMKMLAMWYPDAFGPKAPR